MVLLAGLMTASGTLFGIDGGIRYEVTRNLVEERRFNVQPSAFTTLGADGRSYSKWALGHSIAMIPPYLLGRALAKRFPQREEEIAEFSVALTNLWFTVALAGWLILLGRELGFRLDTSVLLSLLYTFTTMAWQQAKDSFEHPQAALYLTALFFFLHRFSRTRRVPHLCWAGVAFGLSLLTRYTAVFTFAAVVLFLGSLARESAEGGTARKALLWLAIFCCAAAPFGAADLWYNRARYGSFFDTGQPYLFQTPVSPQATLSALWRLTFHWDRGLFLFNPVLLLALPGAVFFYRTRRILARSFLTLVVSTLIFFSLTTPDIRDGGWAWGPRHLADLLPILVLLCAPVFESRSGRPPSARWIGLLAIPLVCLSALIQAASVSVNYNRAFMKKALHLQGYSFASHGLRNSLLSMQWENIRELSRNLAQARRPTLERISRRVTPSSLDDSFTFGAFHFWWVYALLLGASPCGILLYLTGSLVLLGLAAHALWRNLRGRIP